MQIEFWGAAQTVTGSMHLVHADGERILLDCGLFQGKRQESNERNRVFPFDPRSIDAVILSHAHIDHSGNLPNLIKQGYEGPVYCTPATCDLCEIMLADSGYLHEKDAEFLNKKNRRNHTPPVEPLYTYQDALATVPHLRGIPYGEEFRIADNITAKFTDAGHILGSASISLTSAKNGTRKTIGFSGDVGRWGMPIIRDPVSMGRVDVLLLESTYGGKLHDPPGDMGEQLVADISRTVGRGGKIIVPSFSVGRTQDLAYTLHTLFDSGKLPRIPIYIDSPLAVNATEIYRKHPECFDSETYYHITQHHDPFGLQQLRYIRDVEESKELNTRDESAMIISASGMCEAGRILHHLANNIEDPRNTIMIVGYCAEHTLGKRLVDNATEVKIYGKMYMRKAEVVVHNSFSAHADHGELVRYADFFKPNELDQIILIHGDPVRQEILRNGLTGRGHRNIINPERGQRVII
jgi:metallo-beta-lactamase family protein